MPLVLELDIAPDRLERSLGDLVANLLAIDLAGGLDRLLAEPQASIDADGAGLETRLNIA